MITVLIVGLTLIQSGIMIWLGIVNKKLKKKIEEKEGALRVADICIDKHVDRVMDLQNSFDELHKSFSANEKQLEALNKEYAELQESNSRIMQKCNETIREKEDLKFRLSKYEKDVYPQQKTTLEVAAETMAKNFKLPS